MHSPYRLVHFCWSLKNLLVLIYSKLHSESCDYLYKQKAAKRCLINSTVYLCMHFSSLQAYLRKVFRIHTFLQVNSLANMLYVNTNFAIDHFVSKITRTERQSYKNTLLLVRSAWIWTIQRKFISHFSIGSKAARDKVNQIAHVPKERLESWENKGKWQLILRCSRSGQNSSYFQR